MAEFLLRVWAEQVLFDCRDYRVEADTLEAAVELLHELQEKADWGSEAIRHDAVSARESYHLDEVMPLDPQEVVDGASGMTLVDEEGNRVRDLDGVPTGCVQLGEPLL
jgi:hypothetical protein